MRRPFDTGSIEAKWLARWKDGHVYDSTRGQAGEKKFFLHFAYPGISGFLHVGHLRGFTYSDVFVRYKRLTGHRVFFPAGFHASGIPSVGLARRVERQEAATLQYLANNGCPPEQIPKLKDPAEVIRYFSHVYEEDYWRRFGYLIDWRTLCSTIDPAYQRFIQWQFRRLNDAGLLVVKPHFGPHCPTDGAVAVDASETDISKGGGAEVNEYVLLKFTLDDGSILPCATLRPETVYGVTNLWLPPTGAYVRVTVGAEKWIVSTLAAEKLRGQRDDVGATEPVDASTLIGKNARNPLDGRKVPVIPASFVDPNRATGVVMSVPAHAPYDWQALHEARPDVAPIVIIRTPKLEGVPAEVAVRRHGAKSQLDKGALDAATEEVYAAEFHGGEMLPNTGPLSGLKASEAKEEIRAVLEMHGSLATLQDFNEDVVCRCGKPVVVKRIPDQWFVRYSDAALTKASQDHAASMRVFPEEYARDLPKVLDWFGDRACIRRGSWLGTEFPFKPGWIIEPISDSTLYPAFYPVARFVKEGKLALADVDDAFFDFVFLGKGTPKTPLWSEVRADFEYWYPVDINLGGKEHKTVHFPPYVMNHVALFPPEKRPQGIFVNWWVTQKAGQKISKSKGGAEPIPDAAVKYGVDGMRLYYAHIASAHVDLEWDPDVVLDYRARIARLFQFVTDLLDEPPANAPAPIDAWLDDAWNERVAAASKAFEAYDLRQAANALYFEFYADLLWWKRRGGSLSPASRKVLQEWVVAMGPITPFLAEELRECLGGTGFALAASFPQAKAGVDPVRRRQEEYLREVLDDVRNVVKLAQVTARRIVLHTAPGWKVTALAAVHENVSKGERNPGTVIKSLLAMPDLRAHAKDVPAFVNRSMRDAASGTPRVTIDEAATLADAKTFLEQETASAIEVYRADDEAAPDPGRKKALATPGRPGITVE